MHSNSSSLGFVKARAFCAKGGRGRDGWAKARLRMGAGEEVSSKGGTALDAVRSRVVVAYCSTRSCELAVKGVPVVCLTEYVTVMVV